MTSITLVTSLALLASAAADLQPRAATLEVAAVIEENFYDPEAGAKIAADLTREAEAGEYDSYTDELDLAAALTARLSPLDGHLNVDWSPPVDAEAAEEEGEDQPALSWYDVMRRQGHGFEEVRILPGNIGLIVMTGFADIDFRDEADPAKAVADAALAMTADTDALIFDLRNNGGGAPAMTGYLVSALTEGGEGIYNVLHYRGGTVSEAPEIAYHSPDPERPVFILTSARSASAAESFPYMLQAAGRAKIIGERTIGAANPGGEIGTPSGFEVFVPTGRPINPVTKRNWEGEGVAPDTEVEAEDALEEAYEQALASVPGKGPLTKDAAWTLEALQAGYEPSRKELRRLAGSYGPYRFEAVEGGLVLHQGRRMPRFLQALSKGVFFEKSDPVHRFHFVMEGRRAEAVEARSAYGRVVRQPKD
jgi:hypothetical protein